MVSLEKRVALVTGANRGVGAAIVQALLDANVKRVYATARNLNSMTFNDERVTPLELDITDREQIAATANNVSDVNLLVNNAGVNAFGSILSSDLSGVERDMRTNYFGTLDMVRAFAPIIERNGGGNIVNVISICALASMPGLGGYSASKAALFSATQALRPELNDKKIEIHAVFPGPIDTDMNDGIDIEKASPESTAQHILQDMVNGIEDIYPDPVSQDVFKTWGSNPKQLEREFSVYR